MSETTYQPPGPADTTTDEENAVLRLVLTTRYPKGGYTVVSPVARIRWHMDAEERKRSILPHLCLAEVDIADLIDRLFERNNQPTRLSLPSSPEHGYIVDYDGRFQKYFYQDGGGWLQWQKENPTAYGYTTVSVPVYDWDNGLVLAYYGRQAGYTASLDFIFLYRYENGQLKQLKQAEMLVS